MKRVCTLIYYVLAASGLMFSSSAPASAQTSYQYAYVFQTQDDQVIVRTVDSGSPSNTIDLLTLPLAGGIQLQRASVSPDGQWITLSLRTPGPNSTQPIKLVNVNSGEIRDIAANLGYTYDVPVYPQQRVAWSPDSNYLAFNSFDGVGTDTYLYSITDSSLINLTMDQLIESRISWSSDSSEIALMSEDCPTNTTCSVFLEIFDVGTRTRQLYVNVAQWASALYDSALCQLDWSPSGQHISFMKTAREHHYPCGSG